MGRSWEGPGNRGGAVGGAARQPETGEEAQPESGAWHLVDGDIPGAVFGPPGELEGPVAPGQLIAIIEEERGGVPNDYGRRRRGG